MFCRAYSEPVKVYIVYSVVIIVATDMAYSVADIFTYLYFTFLLLMVIITNTFPYITQSDTEIPIIPSSHEIDLEQPLTVGVVVNQFLVLLIGKYTLG